MELSVPTHNASPGVNNPTDSSLVSNTFDNVFALLDEDRSRQLVQQVIPAVIYKGTIEAVGRDDGLDPTDPAMLPLQEIDSTAAAYVLTGKPLRFGSLSASTILDCT